MCKDLLHEILLLIMSFQVEMNMNFYTDYKYPQITVKVVQCCNCLQLLCISVTYRVDHIHFHSYESQGQPILQREKVLLFSYFSSAEYLPLFLSYHKLYVQHFLFFWDRMGRDYTLC